MFRRPSLALLVPLWLALAGGASAEGVRLPDIGSSAGALMSPQEERNYGASMLHELRGMNLVLDDALLDDWINDLGYRLVAHSDKDDRKYTFFIVKDKEINAFAAPGGFIGVNAGLITITDEEDELAGVMAHEIAHITQKHLLRAFEDAQKTSLPIALAMLGALIASSGASGDAAEAVLATGTSLIQQRQINFTRQDEAEADRVGIQTLARAGFDPDAMADFFGRMDRALRPGNDDSNYPSLLRTHPVNTSRISDAKARAESLKRQQAARTLGVRATACGLDVCEEADYAARAGGADPTPAPRIAAMVAALQAKAAAPGNTPVAPPATPRRTAWALMRERARVLSSDNRAATLAYYADNLRTKPEFDTPARHYGYALALLANNQPERALQQLQPLLQAEPDNLAYALAQARAELDGGQRTVALQRYAALGQRSPGNRAIHLAWAEALLASADRADARRAQDLLRPLMAETDDTPDVYLVFARACELAGDTVRAGMAHADAAYLSGRAMDALTLLQTLARRKDLDFYQRARIEARIAEFTPVVLELRHRGVKPGSEGRQLSLQAGCDAAAPRCSGLSWGRNSTAVK